MRSSELLGGARMKGLERRRNSNAYRQKHLRSAAEMHGVEARKAAMRSAATSCATAKSKRRERRILASEG
eukprot:194045-Pleurochrysis_carterae.AAC.1